MNLIPDILNRICADKRREIAAITQPERRGIFRRAETAPPARGFVRTIRSDTDVSIIAEVKKASPSAGVIRPDFDPASVARAYEAGGARCISVLTDGKYFAGSLQNLQEVRAAVPLPVMRKDFILDEIQIAQAKACGADCVLLIAAALDIRKLKELSACARRWGIDTLIEVHTEPELKRAVGAGAGAVGINNRNLHNFTVDLHTTEILAGKAPEETVLVSESGIKGADDIKRLAACGIDAVLIGETLMRAADIEEATGRLCNVVKNACFPGCPAPDG